MLAWSEDPGRSTGAGAKVLCDMDKLLTLVEVQFLHLLFGFQTHPILIFFKFGAPLLSKEILYETSVQKAELRGRSRGRLPQPHPLSISARPLPEMFWDHGRTLVYRRTESENRRLPSQRTRQPLV